MPNYVQLEPDGYIKQVYSGDQSEESISQSITQTMVVIRQIESNHPKKPINFLIDMTAIGNQDLSARRAGAKALKSLPYNKIAIYGLNSFMTHVANLVITAAHKRKTVRQFKNEVSAIAWLME